MYCVKLSWIFIVKMICVCGVVLETSGLSFKGMLFTVGLVSFALIMNDSSDRHCKYNHVLLWYSGYW